MVLELPTLDKFKKRTIVTLVSAPKFFLAAFFWEAFSYACYSCTRETRYYFLTGFGSCLGIIIGHMSLFFIMTPESFLDEIITCVMYGISAFLGPSTTWQKIVNDSIDWHMNFTQAFFYMLTICTLLFWAALVCLRRVNFWADKHLGHHPNAEQMPHTLHSDFWLAVAVGSADAFFLGTIGNQLPGNWLAPMFGVNDSTPIAVAILKAATSALLGFAVSQTMQNCVLSKTWTDGSADNLDEQYLIEENDLRSTTAKTNPTATAGVAIEVKEVSKENRV